MNSFKQGEMDIPIPEDALPTYAGALNGMVDVVDGALIELPKEQRLSAALKVVEALATQYGGFQLYVPKIDSVKRVLRDKRVFEEFTGNNHEELARKHKTSPRHIYRILSEQHALVRSHGTR